MASAEVFINDGFRPVAQSRGSKQTDVRAHNERLLLSLIRRHGSLTKAEISRLTGLSPQAISVIMRKLEDEGLLRRGDVLRGRIGQPSTPLALAADGVLSLGLKIGRRSVELVLLDFVGEVRESLVEAHAWPMPDAVIRFLRKGVAQMMAQLSPDEQQRIAGLGIACPFELWNWADEVGAPAGSMDAWRTADLVQAASTDFPFPVYLENDATAACGAEFVFGRGNEFASFLYIFIGFFIGGGVVLNGALFAGTNGNAGAIGSFPVITKDGKAGQLIDAASACILEARIKADGRDPSPLWSEADGWTQFAPYIDGWIADIAPHLAHAIIASCAIIDFSATIIEGGFPDEVRAAVVSATKAEIERLDLQGVTLPAIIEGQVGRQARAIGAACLPLFDRFILSSTPFLNEVA